MQEVRELVDVGCWPVGEDFGECGDGAFSPGKGALAMFSPPLDSAGNSVRGQRAGAFLSRGLGLNVFASAPHIAEQNGRAARG